MRGYVPPAALWCAARHTSVHRRLATLALARTRASPGLCLGSRGFGLGSGGLTAARKLRAPSLSTPPQLPAAFSTVSCGANLQTELASNPTSHPWHWTVDTELPVHQARRCLHLRAPRSPNRQVGGRLLRCCRSLPPGASADSLTRHATPAASSFCTTLPGSTAYTPGAAVALLLSHASRPWVLVRPASQRCSTPHGSLARLRRRTSVRGAAAHAPHKRQRQLAAQHCPGRVLSLSLRQGRAAHPAQLGERYGSDKPRKAAARQVRKDHGAAHFCVCGSSASRCSLVRCPSHQGPKTPGHPGALRAHVLPQASALGPEASDSALAG